jgi:hypothetical protein
VVEVSIFKDGHALLRREAPRTPNARGEVVLGELPTPVLGSYQPYVTGAGAKLTGTIAEAVLTPNEALATDIATLLLANVGAKVRVIDLGGKQYEGRIAAPVKRNPEEADSEDSRTGSPVLDNGESVLLAETTGVRVIAIQQIRTLQILGPIRWGLPISDRQYRLRMELERPAPPRVTVGATYLQKGLQWIAGYQINLGSGGEAHTRMQATILNELVDLNQTLTRLVVGIPHVYNANAVDPLSLSLSPPTLSQRFSQTAPQLLGGGLMGGGGGGLLPRAGMGMGGGGMGGLGGGGLGGGGRCGAPPEAADPTAGIPPEEADAEGSATQEGTAAREDLFYLPPFPLTLKKGATKVLPLRELSLGYADVYTVDIPFLPQEDPNRSRGLTTEQRLELLGQLYQVRAKHQLRITNRTEQPLTSGTAMIFRSSQLVAHSLLLYTPTGSSSLCMLGEAPEIEVHHSDREVGREEIEAKSGLDSLRQRVNLEGTITLRNRTGGSVEVELTRNVPGNAESAPDGEVALLDGTVNLPNGTQTYRPWVNARTSSARVFWKIRLEPSETRVFRYTWHVFR